MHRKLGDKATLWHCTLIQQREKFIFWSNNAIFSKATVLEKLLCQGIAQSLDDWGGWGLGKGVFDQLMSGVGQSNQLGPIYQLGQNYQLFLAKLYNKDRFCQISWLERFRYTYYRIK